MSKTPREIKIEMIQIPFEPSPKQEEAERKVAEFVYKMVCEKIKEKFPEEVDKEK